MSPKQKAPEGVSWNPDDQEQGGLLDDVDVTITAAECTTWDYAGKAETALALKLTLQPDEGEAVEQYLSAGRLDRLVPSEDGSTFVPAEGSSAKGIPSSSNCGVFMRSLSDAGYPFTHDAGLPEDYSPTNISEMLTGLRCHVLRVPQPERRGLASAEGGRKKTVLTVTKIHSYPWDEKKPGKGKAATPKGTGKAVGKPNGKEAEESDSEAADAAAEVVVELLGTKQWRKGINIEGDEFYKAFFDAVKARKDRKALLAAIQEESFLERDEFLVEDDVLTLA